MIVTRDCLALWLGVLLSDWCENAPAYGDLAGLLCKTRAHLEAMESNWALPCTGSSERRAEMLALLRELATLLGSSCDGHRRPTASRLWGCIAADYYDWLAEVARRGA